MMEPYQGLIGSMYRSLAIIRAVSYRYYNITARPETATKLWTQFTISQGVLTLTELNSAQDVYIVNGSVAEDRIYYFATSAELDYAENASRFEPPEPTILHNLGSVSCPKFDFVSMCLLFLLLYSTTYRCQVNQTERNVVDCRTF